MESKSVAENLGGREGLSPPPF